MNRKITKTIAQSAAEKIASKIYNDKLEELDNQINLIAELIAKKYIPDEVLRCCEKYPSFIGTNGRIYISTEIEEESGYTCISMWIKGGLSFQKPKDCDYLKVSNEDYNAIRRVYDERERVKALRDSCVEEVNSSLLALKSENNIKEHFPEALDYIVFPAVKALPAPKFNAIRILLKNSKQSGDDSDSITEKGT